MKYALIADIHGNLPALEAVIQDALDNNIDNFIFLGDYCVGLAYSNEVMDSIRSINSSYVVSGNEEDMLMNLNSIEPDQWPKGQYEAGPWFYKNLTEINRSYISDIPEEIIINGNDHPPIFIFHKPQRYFSGTSPCLFNPLYFAEGMDDKKFDCDSFHGYSNALLNSDAKLHSIISELEDGAYIFGHTHIPLCWEKDGKLLINPGSCGLPLDFNTDASYGILEWVEDFFAATVKRVKYDVNTTINHTRDSEYANEVRVWSGIITKELETAREHAIPFIRFTEKFASDHHDMVRPFRKETWYSAYEEWCKY